MRIREILICLGLGPLSILSAQGASGTKTIQLKYADPEQLRRIFSGQSHVMEADRDLKVLTFHGSPAFVKEVEEAVKRFDVAPPVPPNVQITIYLLTVAEPGSSSGTLPPELAAVGTELKAAGGQNFRLADFQMIRVRAGQSGEAIGSASPSTAVATLSRIRFEGASISPDPKGDVISLDGLRVWLNVPSTAETPRPQPKSNGDVAADIDVAQGQAAIVAKTGADKPLVVVVRASATK